MADTFTCDNCGQEYPRDQMKEAFREEDGKEIREELCPNCLDERMNEASKVYGVRGEEKKAGAYLADDEGDRPAAPTGERDA